jgi:hypothetical protein
MLIDLKPHFSVYLKISQKREQLLPFLRHINHKYISERIPVGDSIFMLYALCFMLYTL